MKYLLSFLAAAVLTVSCAKVSGVILNAKDIHDYNDFGKEANSDSVK